MQYRLLLVFTAILFSTGGAAIKGCGFTPWQVAGFRSGVAALALAVFVPDSRRRWEWRLAPVGLAYATTLILFVLATRLTTAANAIFLQSTAPLYLLAIGPVLLRERVRRADLSYMAAIACGMALLFATRQAAGAASAPHPAVG